MYNWYICVCSWVYWFVSVCNTPNPQYSVFTFHKNGKPVTNILTQTHTQPHASYRTEYCIVSTNESEKGHDENTLVN